MDRHAHTLIEGKQTDIRTYMYRDKRRDKIGQTDRQTDRQTDEQTDGWTDRQMD